jgi:hypothetical protein
LLSRHRNTNRSHHKHYAFHFHCAFGFPSPLTRVHLKLLGPCFKTGRMGDQPDTERAAEHTISPNNNTNQQHMCCQLASSPKPTARVRPPHQQPTSTAVSELRFPSEEGPLRTNPTAKSTSSAHSVRKCTAQLCETHCRQPCGMPTTSSQSQTDEYALDTLAPSASITSVSRSLALSFQSAFQLSLTVLVCYRSLGRI